MMGHLSPRDTPRTPVQQPIWPYGTANAKNTRPVQNSSYRASRYGREGGGGGTRDGSECTLSCGDVLTCCVGGCLRVRVGWAPARCHWRRGDGRVVMVQHSVPRSRIFGGRHSGSDGRGRGRLLGSSARILPGCASGVRFHRLRPRLACACVSMWWQAEHTPTTSLAFSTDVRLCPRSARPVG